MVGVSSKASRDSASTRRSDTSSSRHREGFFRRRGSPRRAGRDSPSRRRCSSSRRRDSPSRRRGSPSRRRDSPSRRRGSPSRRRNSPSRRRDSPARRRDSPARRRDSPARRRDSPSRRRDSPSRRRDSLARRLNILARRRDSPSRRRGSPSRRRDRPSRRGRSPSSSDASPNRAFVQGAAAAAAAVAGGLESRNGNGSDENGPEGDGSRRFGDYSALKRVCLSPGQDGRAPDRWDVQGVHPSLIVGGGRENAHGRRSPPPPSHPPGTIDRPLRSHIAAAPAPPTLRCQPLPEHLPSLLDLSAPEPEDYGDDVPPAERFRIAMKCRGRSFSPTRELSPLRCSISQRGGDRRRVVQTVVQTLAQPLMETELEDAERFRRAMNIAEGAPRRVKFRVTLNGRRGGRQRSGRQRGGRQRGGWQAARTPSPDPVVTTAAARFMDRMDAHTAAAKQRLRENLRLALASRAQAAHPRYPGNTP